MKRKKRYTNKIAISDNKSKIIWSIIREMQGKNVNKNNIHIPGEPLTVANELN